MDSGKLKKYPSLQGRKCGIYMSGNECFYLYGNRFCEAKCELLMINSDVINVLSESCNSLLVYLTEEKGGDFTCYCGGKLSLRIKEFVLLYTIPLVNHEVCGVISGGSELPIQDVQFTDRKLLVLISKLIHRHKSLSSFKDENFREVAQAIENAEIEALNELYLAGKSINDK